jgi:hypothetical protein
MMLFTLAVLLRTELSLEARIPDVAALLFSGISMLVLAFQQGCVRTLSAEINEMKQTHR